MWLNSLTVASIVLATPPQSMQTGSNIPMQHGSPHREGGCVVFVQGMERGRQAGPEELALARNDVGWLDVVSDL